MIEDPRESRSRQRCADHAGADCCTFRCAHGFLVDALGGAGALDYDKPVVPEHPRLLAQPSPAMPDRRTISRCSQHSTYSPPATSSSPPPPAISAVRSPATCCAGMARNSGPAASSRRCVRDLPGIRQVGLPCFAAGVTPNSPARQGPARSAFNHRRGAAVGNGDVIAADQDGVVGCLRAHRRVIERLVRIRRGRGGTRCQSQGGLQSMPWAE